MMRQYLQIKETAGDSLLFFRLGDFYEMFFKDAKTASKELDIVLTGRDCGEQERAPMCGVPYHSCESYIARLIQKGYKVSICEQVEDPAEAQGIVRREIVRTITPGTIMETGMLDETKNNYVCALYRGAGGIGLAFADVSTGEFSATFMDETDLEDRVVSELARISPSEVLLSDGMFKVLPVLSFLRERGISHAKVPEHYFFEKDAHERVSLRFKSTACDAQSPCICAVGGLLAYIQETQKELSPHFVSLNIYSDREYMRLDPTALHNLELIETLRTREKKGSLLWALDFTETSMGARVLRRWVEKPFLKVSDIHKRQEAVAQLHGDGMTRMECMRSLRKIPDLERICGRISFGSAGGRDLRALCDTVSRLPELKELLSVFSAPMLNELNDKLDTLSDIAALINEAIVDEPPFSTREGGIIRPLYHPEVDELRDIIQNGRGILSKIESRERERTGIKNLKVGYNKVFGYYIEITNSNKESAPADYIRKQTLSNCERFITQELKEAEVKILGAGERINKLEFELFETLRGQVAEAAARILRTASALAEIDALCSLAEAAARNNYVRPVVDSSGLINIKDGRHPVVELTLESEIGFVPNDTLLDHDENRTAVITGPNMAGKSTYMRQIALIVLMAQMGGFVPARRAHIGVCDAIYTRVGASDDLSRGQSTFMVEMSEVSHILRHATGKSLILFDEIGRGTSTFDGMSIARAVLEHVTNKQYIGARSLFATHYHELTELEDLVDGVKNYNVAVLKRGDEITFLRKILRGGADDSYGIQVAIIAGMPGAVVERAKVILDELETKERSKNGI